MSRRPPTPKSPPRKASPAELRDVIRGEALRLGFDAVGFAPATLTAEARKTRLERLGAFVAAGRQGDMGWLGDRTEARADPATLWPEARTVVSLALNYGPKHDPLAVLEQRERAAISVYAQGRDYHDVMKTRLKALGRFIWDTYRHDVRCSSTPHP
jgi:epoxyqueuosine reductase